MERSTRLAVPLLGIALIVTLALLALSLFRPAPAASTVLAATPAASDVDLRGISVVGEGVIKVKPDVAHVNLAVITTAQTAQEAVAQNATLMTKVMERLQALGVKKDDIKTVGVNIYPLIDYTNRDPQGNQRITGYRAQDSIVVSVDVDKAGQIFDEGVAAGANQSSSITFGLRDDTAFRQQALAAAAKSARVDADTIAQALGLTIKAVKHVSVEFGGGKIEVRAPAADTRATGAQAAPPTPINPGDLTVTARVRVVYEY